MSTHLVRVGIGATGIILLTLTLLTATGVAPVLGSVTPCPNVGGCTTSLTVDPPVANSTGLTVNYTVTGSVSSPIGGTVTITYLDIQFGSSVYNITIPSMTVVEGTFTLPMGTLHATASGSYALIAMVTAKVSRGFGMPPVILSARSGATTVTVVKGGAGNTGGCGSSPCPTLSASFNYNTTGLQGYFIATAVSQGGVLVQGYSWLFGDGTTGTGLNPLHTYSSAGTYSVTLTVRGVETINSTYSTIGTALTSTVSLNVTVAPLTNSNGGSGGSSPGLQFVLTPLLGVVMGASIGLIVGAVTWRLDIALAVGVVAAASLGIGGALGL